MQPRNVIALLLILTSFVLLIPGLTKPLITISAFFELLGSRTELFTQTRSIIQTVKNLHESGDNFVAGLILLFSVIIPFGKGVLLILVMLLKSSAPKFKVFKFVGAISKWSMADVFVVGIFVAFLAAKANSNLDANLEIGFFYFATYCLLSIASHQVMVLAPATSDEGGASLRLDRADG
jgi:uncharacterized paraquat-inducible protein A